MQLRTIVGYVKATRGEILTIYQLEVGHIDSATLCSLIISVFNDSDIVWVIGVAKLDKPMSIGIRIQRLGAASSTIATIEQQQICISVVFLPQHFKRSGLQSVKIVARRLIYKFVVWDKSQSPHTAITNQGKSVESRQFCAVYPLLTERDMH